MIAGKCAVRAWMLKAKAGCGRHAWCLDIALSRDPSIPQICPELINGICSSSSEPQVPALHANGRVLQVQMLAAVWISHRHADHMMGLQGLLEARGSSVPLLVSTAVMCYWTLTGRLHRLRTFIVELWPYKILSRLSLNSALSSRAPLCCRLMMVGSSLHLLLQVIGPSAVAQWLTHGLPHLKGVWRFQHARDFNSGGSARRALLARAGTSFLDGCLKPLYGLHAVLLRAKIAVHMVWRQLQTLMRSVCPAWATARALQAVDPELCMQGSGICRASQSSIVKRRTACCSLCRVAASWPTQGTQGPASALLRPPTQLTFSSMRLPLRPISRPW